MSARYQAIAIAFLLLGALGRGVHADDSPGPGYVLGVDDVIDIAVLNHVDLNKTLVVLPDGSITFPWAGRLQAAGRTPDELAALIRAELEKTKNNVLVTVAVKEVHSRRVRIVGAVKNPSAYDLKANWRMLDLVAVAGGLTTRPARTSGRIIRSGAKLIPLSVQAATAAPEGDANPVLQVDDLVLLEEADPARNKVFVMGQVNKPGAFDLGDTGTSVLSVLSQAGNVTDSAALTQAYILRDKTEIPVNLRPMLVEGQRDANVRDITLQAGDVLFIPQIEKRIAVMGQVNRPGAYPLPETRQLMALDALSLAGGQTQNGDLRKAGVIRSVNGKWTAIPLDLEKILQKNSPAANLRLQPDDVLFVPTRGDRRFTWTDLLSPLASLAYVGFRVIR